MLFYTDIFLYVLFFSKQFFCKKNTYIKASYHRKEQQEFRALALPLLIKRDMSQKINQLLKQLEQYQSDISITSELMNLAEQLLDLAEKEKNHFAEAVAHKFLALFHNEKGNTQLTLQHASLCYEISSLYQYSEYYITSCNMLGITYALMSEQFLALDYYLKGLFAAKSVQNFDLTSRILNNIGDMFSDLKVHDKALDYFKQAKLYREQGNLTNDEPYVIIIMNIIESSLMLGKEEAAKEYLPIIIPLINEEKSRMIASILSVNEILYYFKENNLAKAEKLLLQLFRKIPLLSDDSHIFTALLRLKDVIYQLQDREIGQQYIDILQMMAEKMDNINFQLYCQEVMIEYYDIIQEEQKKQSAIIEYYYINEQNNKLRKESFCNSLIAKVQLEELLQEQAEILRENQKLKNLSEMDELTQVYNRQTAQKLILQKISEEELTGSAALIICDLDYFKTVNDTYGHIAGDRVLSTVGALLKRSFREHDIIGRLGGDEFIIFIHNPHHQTNELKQMLTIRLTQLAQQVRNIPIEDCSIHISASIGITLLTNFPVSFIELYNNADIALYESKKKGRDCITFFNDLPVK